MTHVQQSLIGKAKNQARTVTLEMSHFCLSGGSIASPLYCILKVGKEERTDNSVELCHSES